MKYSFTLSGLLSLFGAWVLTFNDAAGQSEPSPSFFRANYTPSMPELLAEPPSNIYGSTIHVWYFRDQAGQLREIAVTGHAESRTCQRMSSLFFNSYFAKSPSDGDFFVAGAGRLVNDPDTTQMNQLRQNPVVAQYEATEKESRVNKIMLTWFASSEDEAEVNNLRATVDSLDKALGKQRNDALVAEYLRLKGDEDALRKVYNETSQIAAVSGLVEEHQVPYELIQAVRQRLNDARSVDSLQLLTFDDLLAEFQVAEAVVWIEAQRLSDRTPLEIRLPATVLSRESFTKAERENRDQLLVAMLGDAKRRKSFFVKHKNDAERERRRLQTMSESQLSEIIVLNICIDMASGTERPCPPGQEIRMTWKEYRDEQLPRLIKSYEKELDYLEKLMVDLGHNSTSKNARIDELNHMTLIDAMLRNWDLPVGQSQEAFKAWRRQQRDPIWQTIRKNLQAQNIDPNSLTGSNLVFDINYNQTELVIKPYYVLDLKRSILVLDPKRNVITIENTWDHRTTTLAPTGQPPSKASGLNWLDKALSTDKTNWKKKAHDEAFAEIVNLTRQTLGLMYGVGHVQHLDPKEIVALEAFDQLDQGFYDGYRENGIKMYRDSLLAALTSHPELTWRWIEKNFCQYSPQALQESEAAQKSARVRMNPDAILGCIPTQNFNSREAIFNYLNGYYHCLESNSNIPVDFHFRFAMALSNVVSAAMSARQSPFFRSNREPWDILIGVQHGDLILKSSIELTAAGSLRALEFDAFAQLQKRMNLIQRRDPDYYDALLRTRGEYEKSSQELEELTSQSAKDWTLMEMSGFYYVRTLDLLKSRAQAQNANTYLWEKKRTTLDSVIDCLNKATAEDLMATDSFFVIVRDRVKYMKKHGIELDYLAIMELSSLLREGCDNNQKIINREENSLNLPHYKELLARNAYESGDYNAAFELVFAPEIPLINYSGVISWVVLPDDRAKQPEAMEFIWEDKSLLCQADFEGTLQTILKVNGLKEEQGIDLRDYLQKLSADTWGNEGRLSQQLLLHPVPRQNSVRILSEIMAEPEVRVLLLKVMAYHRMTPAKDLVPISGEDWLQASDEKLAGDPVQSVYMPSLKELKNQLIKN